MTPFPIQKIRGDFPLLHQQVYNKPLVYLDNAATTQKPQQVIDEINRYYSHDNANIHRGVHYLSQQATIAFEEARKTVQLFIGAKHSHEIIFTKGTTEAINLVASSFGRKFLTAGDEIILSAMEHHSNIVPWQMIAEEKGAKLKIIPVNENGELMYDPFVNLLNEKTSLIAITHVSNVLGTINPVKEMIALAHKYDIPVLIDGAQGISHQSVDVQDMDCDFYCFSGHKVYGPMGNGILYGKEKWLEAMLPYQGGGEMIKEVRFERTIFNELPFKFEAGTPDVAAALGLSAALNYVKDIGMQAIADHEHDLLTYATEEIKKIDGISIFGQAKNKTSVLSFLMGDIHPYDAGTILDKLGVAVRTGHHCAMPLMEWFNIPGTIRASFALYNTREEIDVFIEAMKKAKSMLE